MPSIADVSRLYLENAQHNQTQRTVVWRAHILDVFQKRFGPDDAASVRPLDFTLWVNSQSQWRSAWTRKGAVGTIRTCLNWAEQMGLIARNPIRHVTMPEGEPVRPMTDDEFAKASEAASRRFKPLLLFLRLTGCRPCEASALTAGDIDWTRGVAMLQRHKTYRSTGKPRVILLSEEAQEVLRQTIAHAPAATIFRTKFDRAWSRTSIAHEMVKLRRKLGLSESVRCYGLRHKFGTDAIKAGVPIKLVSTLMGHSNCRTTERYVHIAEDLDLLSQALKRTLSTS
jgi:integrase